MFTHDHLIDRYLAPEYFMHGIVSEKTDIYSFGVLLLEIITGRHALDHLKQSIVLWVSQSPKCWNVIYHRSITITTLEALAHCDFLCCRPSLYLKPITLRTLLILLWVMIMTGNKWIVLFWLHLCVLSSILSYAPAWVRQVCSLRRCITAIIMKNKLRYC